MRQVVKVSIKDVRISGELSTFAVYWDNKWGAYPYRLCQLLGRKKKVWLYEFDTLTEATNEAIKQAMPGGY